MYNVEKIHLPKFLKGRYARKILQSPTLSCQVKGQSFPTLKDTFEHMAGGHPRAPKPQVACHLTAVAGPEDLKEKGKSIRAKRLLIAGASAVGAVVAAVAGFPLLAAGLVLGSATAAVLSRGAKVQNLMTAADNGESYVLKRTARYKVESTEGGLELGDCEGAESGRFRTGHGSGTQASSERLRAARKVGERCRSVRLAISEDHLAPAVAARKNRLSESSQAPLSRRQATDCI